MSFAFDLDTEINKLKCTLANPANPANPASKVSNISKVSRGRPQTMILTFLTHHPRRETWTPSSLKPAGVLRASTLRPSGHS